MATFLVVHGAWSGGWAWQKMRPRLQRRGHAIFTPTCTGLGERAHLGGPDVDLEAHVRDIGAVLDAEGLRDVILVGHSYGGMVATVVADRMPQRIARLVYLDAFVPENGQALRDLIPANAPRAAGDEADWRAPPNPMPPDTSEEDLAWALPRRIGQPRKTFTQAARLGGAVQRLRRSYIYCSRAGPGDTFRRFAERARGEAGWDCHELDASHNPHITMPDELAALLDRIARTDAS
jgi:pimeloyl-ACP methyl ester carboxylesterase